MKETLIINLIGGPGSGKSTCASGIFYQLKKMGVNCELALEFAKDKVWEESYKILDDQFYIFGKQYHKLFRLCGKVDVVITDSPLIVSMLYNKMPSVYFNDFVIEQFNMFNNLTFFVNRPEHYQTEGRIQTKKESQNLDGILKHLLNDFNVHFTEVSCEDAVDMIVNTVKEKLEL